MLRLPWGFGGWALALALLTAGCASPPRPAPLAGAAQALWTGRLALRVESDQVQSFSAGFELTGNAQTGALSLFSPLGSTVAQLAWSPGDARLRWDGQERNFESMDALTRYSTGTELPVAGIFRWLSGENAVVDGWQADLRGLAAGRLVARRSSPPPLVELRLILE